VLSNVSDGFQLVPMKYSKQVQSSQIVRAVGWISEAQFAVAMRPKLTRAASTLRDLVEPTIMSAIGGKADITRTRKLALAVRARKFFFGVRRILLGALLAQRVKPMGMPTAA
jgi:hypothetical protein